MSENHYLVKTTARTNIHTHIHDRISVVHSKICWTTTQHQSTSSCKLAVTYFRESSPMVYLKYGHRFRVYCTHLLELKWRIVLKLQQKNVFLGSHSKFSVVMHRQRNNLLIRIIGLHIIGVPVRKSCRNVCNALYIRNYEHLPFHIC